MLRISAHSDSNVTTLLLEGRIGGPWTDELNRAWEELRPQLGDGVLTLDLRNLTFCDEAGKQVLRAIVTESHAEILTDTPWTQYLADEIREHAYTGRN